MNQILRFLLLLSMSVFFLLPVSEAQVIKGMLIGGVNFSQVDGDEVYGFHRQGVNAGVGAIVPFTPKWSLTLETLFAQKGAYQGPQYNVVRDGEILTGEYDLRMNYVEVPVLIHYTDKEVISAGAGLSYGRLVGITEKEHGRLVTGTTVNSGTYATDNLEIIGDLKLPLYQNFKVNLRYSYSLVSLRTRDFYNLNGVYVKTRQQFHNLFSIRLLWIFNEKGKTLRDLDAERAL